MPAYTEYNLILVSYRPAKYKIKVPESGKDCFLFQYNAFNSQKVRKKESSCVQTFVQVLMHL